MAAVLAGSLEAAQAGVVADPCWVGVAVAGGAPVASACGVLLGAGVAVGVAIPEASARTLMSTHRRLSWSTAIISPAGFLMTKLPW